MASDIMATAHFDGGHLHSANHLTVYIDDVKTCSFEGGRTCSVKVTPGDHIIRFLVYNDSSEEAYWLGPFSRNFEAGVEYDLYPGKDQLGSGSGSSSDSSSGSGSDSGGADGYGWCCLIILVPIVIVLLQSCGG